MSTGYPRVAESRLEMSTYPLTVVTVRNYYGLGIDWKHALPYIPVGPIQTYFTQSLTYYD